MENEFMKLLGLKMKLQGKKNKIIETKNKTVQIKNLGHGFKMIFCKK